MFAEEEYINYFKAIAEKCIAIKSCFTDPEQVFSCNVQYPVMLLQFPDSEVTGANDNNLERFEFNFWIMKPAPSQDFSRMDSARAECKDIAMDVVRRILYDARNRGQLGSAKPVNVEKNSIRFRKDGPFTDNVIAIQCTGVFIQPVNLAYNSDKFSE